MNNEELDSQLSAMFDDELPAAECELLARRLARDDGLKARWGRYAVIGACIRMERGAQAVMLSSAARVADGHAGASSGERRPHGDLASRVSRLVADEPLLAGAGFKGVGERLANSAVSRWWQPLAGGAVVAAGVAAAAILWLRARSPDAPIVGQTQIIAETGNLPRALPNARTVVSAALPSGGAAGMARDVSDSVGSPADADSYVVPAAVSPAPFAPPLELANFVVAHSEYSMPLLRRSALSALVADGLTGGDTGADAADTAQSAASAESSAAADSGHAAGSSSRTLDASYAHYAH